MSIEFSENLESGRTTRLNFRRADHADLDEILRIHSDPAANVHNPNGPMRDLAGARAYLDMWNNDWATAGIGYWAFSRRDDPDEPDDRIVGFGGLRYRQLGHDWIHNMYYRLAPQAWGQGFAPEIAAVARHAWADHFAGRGPLLAITRPGNTASQRTAVRAGLSRRIDLDFAENGAAWIVFGLSAHERSAHHSSHE